MKKLLFIVVAFLMIGFTSCEKQAADTKVGVSFTIQDGPTGIAKKGGLNLDNDIPECIDGVPTTVDVIIDGVSYDLDVLTGLNYGTETTVIKLEPGKHVVSSFIVYNENEEVLWVSPLEGSPLDQQWDLNGVELTFETVAFTKARVDIDVMCYEDANFKAFGFNWFQFHAYELKPLCFFGDICTKFYEDFNQDGSPYAGLINSENYDFPAMYNIALMNSEGDTIATGTNVKGNLNEPVCVSYLDNLEVADEQFTFGISVYGPDGVAVNVYNGTFTDSDWTNTDKSSWGGEDGIFEFVMGNCYDDTNVPEVMLPAYLMFPKTGKIRIDAVKHAPPRYEYFDVTLLGSTWDNPLFPEELAQGNILGAYCGDLYNNIPFHSEYTVDVYSSLNDNLPTMYADYPWGPLNWLANQDRAITESHLEGKMLQAIIWFTIHDGKAGLKANIKSHLSLTTAQVDEAENAAQYMLSEKQNFIPQTGQYSLMLFDPVEGSGPDVSTEYVQLVIVRVDP